MLKLFSDEDLDTNVTLPKKIIEVRIENSDISDIVESHEDSIKVAVEAISRASNDLFIVGQLKVSLETKKLSSVEYFTTIENYNLCLQSISNNLDIPIKIPSMEDFKNPYGTKASHQFVVESFVEFMKRIWEKIKSFFKDFFKKIALFFKRLVNASLEMDEYEEYIEDLIRNVKQSNKKSVEPVKFDSKLPSLVSDFGMQFMSTDYLFNKGRSKIENIGNLITYLTDKSFTDLEKNLKDHVKEITSTFTSTYRPSPDEARSTATNFRQNFIDAFTKNVFHYDAQYNALPADVQTEVMNNFDREQLKRENINFYSLVNYRNNSEALPKNFNLYFVNSHYNTGIEGIDIPTAKLLIIPSTNKNTHIENSMNTIATRDALLKFYEFYKKFSKSFNVDRINSRMENFDIAITNILKALEKPFQLAVETGEFILHDEPINNPNLPPPVGPIIEPPGAKISSAPTDGSADWAKEISNRRNREDTSNRQDSDRSENSSNNLENNINRELREKTRREFEYLERFMFNYMHCVQSFLKEFSLNIATTGQECRYEMIKLLYNSAKQF